MNFFDATIFGFAAWRIGLAVALILGYVILKIYWSRKPKLSGAKPEPSRSRQSEKAVKDFMSTMRLTDTQRIDRLHRVVTLTAGESADLKDLSFGRLAKLSVEFNGVEHSRGQEFAHIKVELGGATANCGAAVEELSDNEFLVPRATTDEQRCSIHYICGKADAVSFLQVKVQKINSEQKSAAIDVLHVRGRRAA